MLNGVAPLPKMYSTLIWLPSIVALVIQTQRGRFRMACVHWSCGATLSAELVAEGVLCGPVEPTVVGAPDPPPPLRARATAVPASTSSSTAPATISSRGRPLRSDAGAPYTPGAPG